MYRKNCGVKRNDLYFEECIFFQNVVNGLGFKGKMLRKLSDFKI